MIFGLGESFGFIMLNLSSMNLPFLAGRSKPFDLTRNVCRNLGLTLTDNETSSRTKAWAHLEAQLASGLPVGLQLDCFYLPYFRDPPHFAGHFVAALRLTDAEVEVVDTIQQGGVQRVSRAALDQARHARGPMAARARAYTIRGAPVRSIGEAALNAVRGTAAAYLNPPFSGMGARGITKLGASLPTWADRGARQDLQLAADLIERAGTGGALFRSLYSDFLDEASDILPHHRPALQRARGDIAEAASRWSLIASCLERAFEPGALTEAAAQCGPIAALETSAMRALTGL